MAPKTYTIGFIKSDKKEIKGKDCDFMNVKLLNAEGREKWESIYSFNKCYSAAAVCNAGDVVDVTYEKKTVNGKDYFNVVGFTRTGEGGGEKQSVIPSSTTSTPTKTYGGGKSDDTQLSICRQSSNTTAMNFVVGMLANGLYGKKANPEMLFEEVKRFAKKFESYVTLKDDYNLIDTAMPTIGSVPFEEDGSDESLI